jgi:hypothetical protein
MIRGKHLVERVVIAVMVVVTANSIGVAHADGSSANWLTKFYAWSCETIKYGCAHVARSVVEPRSGERRPHGGALVSIDVKSRATRTIWADCECWSPVPLKSGAVAVATSSGIFEVPLDSRTKPRSILMTEDVRELIGTELRTDRSLLFLRTSHANDCEFEPWLLNPSTHATQAVSANELPCGSNVDFQSLIKPSQISGGGTVLTVKYRGQFEIDVQSKDGITPLFADSETHDRFDAVWIDSQTIVFVTER